MVRHCFWSNRWIHFDGDGLLGETAMLVDAHLFVLPIGDPFVLLLEGFEQLSVVGAGD